jgi:hypothetical protein
MTRSRRNGLVVLAATCALALGACAPANEAVQCSGDGQCPAQSRCVSASCVTNVAPVAALRLPSPGFEAFALVAFDAAGSSDGDAAQGDAVEAYHWTFRAVSAACAAPVVAGLGAVAQVRFGCEGRWAVDLVVTDRLGVDSVAASAEFDVDPFTGTQLVSAGADLATDHACQGAPLVCRPVGAIALSASASAPGLTFLWSVLPPADRSLDGTRSVTFSPRADAPSASASIETLGTAISGDWIFRVEARDAYGAVGAAFTRVSIGNRPPTISATPTVAIDHQFDPVASRFGAFGSVPFTTTDPDGDPVSVAGTWRHVGDGGSASFSGGVQGSAATVSVEVPYGQDSDALFLRGGTGLARTLELAARDPNGGSASTSVAVDVGNRPPEPVVAPGTVEAPHAFDATGSRYVATATLGTWTDPDGDPMATPFGADAPCSALSISAGIVTVGCTVPYAGTPRVQDLAGPRSVLARVADPWSVTSAAYTVDVQNAAPSFATIGLTPASFSCTLGCCSFVPGEGCLVFRYTYPDVAFTAAVTVSDPEGDPLVVASSEGESGACPGGTCPAFSFGAPGSVTCASEPPPPPSGQLVVTDGAAAPAQTVRLDRVGCDAG